MNGVAVGTISLNVPILLAVVCVGYFPAKLVGLGLERSDRLRRRRAAGICRHDAIIAGGNF